MKATAEFSERDLGEKSWNPNGLVLSPLLLLSWFLTLSSYFIPKFVFSAMKSAAMSHMSGGSRVSPREPREPQVQARLKVKGTLACEHTGHIGHREGQEPGYARCRWWLAARVVESPWEGWKIDVDRE